ncbi:MAG: radical SAM protein [Candidatus Omnitrophota bacterium]|nr:MAG: radical SAM protein [Candidatus Omnitrophota bacterium]
MTGNRSKAKRLEFHISYKCVNNCIFCSEAGQLNKRNNHFVDFNIIQNKLKYFAEKGLNHITLTGGEPTFHPSFVEIIQSAKQLMYTVYCSSNGGLFSLKRFCDKTLFYVDEICFSLHGHSGTLHNLHTANRESFSRCMNALENIERSKGDIFLFINTVITKYNVSSLEKVIDLVSNFKKVKQILFSNFAPEGNGLANFKKLVVPLKEIKTAVPRLVEYANKKALIIRFFGLPLCVLKGYELYTNDFHWSPRITVEQRKSSKNIFLKETLSCYPTRNRIKIHVCESCSMSSNCGGIFKRYYLEFKDKEFAI